MIEVKTYAKVNLTLEILNKRPNDGFHNIQSIMQNIDLFDVLSFNITNIESENQIEINGNVNSIPYDNTNLVYRAIELFFEKTSIKNKKVEVYINKNIPVEAGLAGGSSNAVGTFVALNKYFNNILKDNELHSLCKSLGSDLNFCLVGGTCLCTSRGEVVQKLDDVSLNISLIKPLNIGIKAGYAYKKYAEKQIKTLKDKTSKLVRLIQNNQFDEKLVCNDLELPLLNEVNEFKNIKKVKPNSIMTGSGSVFYIINDTFNYNDFEPDRYLIFNNIKTFNKGYEVL